MGLCHGFGCLSGSKKPFPDVVGFATLYVIIKLSLSCNLPFLYCPTSDEIILTFPYSNKVAKQFTDTNQNVYGKMMSKYEDIVTQLHL